MVKNTKKDVGIIEYSTKTVMDTTVEYKSFALILIKDLAEAHASKKLIQHIAQYLLIIF